MKWVKNATSGRIVAGGNGPGAGTHQLWRPLTVVLDKKNNSLIICDEGNRRIVRWSLENTTNGSVLITDTPRYDLALDTEGYLYISQLLQQ